MDEDGDVKIMFFKAIGDNATIFKTVQKNVSYEPFENFKKIVSQQKKKLVGKRVLYEFSSPLEIFEK